MEGYTTWNFVWFWSPGRDSSQYRNHNVTPSGGKCRFKVFKPSFSLAVMKIITIILTKTYHNTFKYTVKYATYVEDIAPVFVCMKMYYFYLALLYVLHPHFTGSVIRTYNVVLGMGLMGAGGITCTCFHTNALHCNTTPCWSTVNFMPLVANSLLQLSFVFRWNENVSSSKPSS